MLPDASISRPADHARVAGQQHHQPERDAVPREHRDVVPADVAQKAAHRQEGADERCRAADRKVPRSSKLSPTAAREAYTPALRIEFSLWEPGNDNDRPVDHPPLSTSRPEACGCIHACQATAMPWPFPPSSIHMEHRLQRHHVQPIVRVDRRDGRHVGLPAPHDFALGQVLHTVIPATAQHCEAGEGYLSVAIRDYPLGPPAPVRRLTISDPVWIDRRQ